MKDRLKKCCVSSKATLRESLKAIDEGAVGIALVLSQEGMLLGTLTDGDIRRALLAGSSLDEPLLPFVQKEFTVVGPENTRTEVLDLMQARLLHQVPIVDSQFQVLGLHLLHEVLGAIERPNWALIMAGGKGTRLGDLTQNIPKPMLKVAGRPILERLVLHLVGSGIKDIYISVHYLGHMIEEYFKDGSSFGCRIHYLREDTPLGTGGALNLLPAQPSHPILVCNGDLVTQVDIDGLLNFHGAGNHEVSVCLTRYSHQIPYGCVEVEDGKVLGFEEKPTLTRLVNAGIYCLSPAMLEILPKGYFAITDLVEEALRCRKSIGAFIMQEDWLDVGHRDQLKQAREGKA